MFTRNELLSIAHMANEIYADAMHDGNETQAKVWADIEKTAETMATRIENKEHEDMVNQAYAFAFSD